MASDQAIVDVVLADVGFTMRVQVTATNAIGSSAALSDKSALIRRR